MVRKLIAAKIAMSVALLCSSAVYAQTPIHLTATDRAEIWRGLGRDAMRTSIPAGLHVGERAPDTMRLLAFGRHFRKRAPAIRHYVYALSQGEVLIVDRRTRTIVSIVHK